MYPCLVFSTVHRGPQPSQYPNHYLSLTKRVSPPPTVSITDLIPDSKVAPGPESSMVHPLGQKRADPRLFTALINELPTHKSRSCNRYHRASTLSGPLKVTAYCLAPLSGWELHTECAGWSGARGPLATNFCVLRPTRSGGKASPGSARIGCDVDAGVIADYRV